MTNIPPNSFDWSDARVAVLRQMHADGASGGDIAKHFGITRNAAIGKTSRMGLRRRAKAPARPRPRQPRAEVIIPFTPPTKRTEVIMDITDADVPLAQRVTIMQLQNCHCRWPLEPGKAVTYCGATDCDVEKGVPYCPSHARRAFMPARPRA